MVAARPPFIKSSSQFCGYRLSLLSSAIIISSDSSDESIGIHPKRPSNGLILFGDIPTVIPSTSVVAPETSTIAPVISSAAPMGNQHYPSSSHDFLLLLLTAPPGIRCDGRANLIHPGRLSYLVDLTRTHLNGHIITHLLPVRLRILRQFILWVWMRQIRLIRDLRLEDVFTQKCCYAAEESTTISPVDLVPLSMPVTRSLAPTRADLSPLRKRFRDSYSSEASIERDAEVGLTRTRVDMELGISDGDEVGDHVE
ncbi:hypothetical protein Tco_0099152, partial [Tanacetum coccineum]